MFSKAIQYLEVYRQRKYAALNNTKRARWFTGGPGIGTLTAVVDLFNSDAENQLWSSINSSKTPDTDKLQAARLQVNWLAGHRQDIREQWAVGDTHEPRTGCDADRHNYSHTKQIIVTSRNFVQRVTELAKGLT